MNISLSELLKKGRIEKTPADQTQIGNLLEISKRDISVAEHLLSVNVLDHRFQIPRKPEERKREKIRKRVAALAKKKLFSLTMPL